MNHSTDYLRLVALTLAGSRDAFGELYEATIKDVYKTVCFLVKEQSDAEDVIQEIYMQVYRSLDKFDANRPFRPWLMGIVMRQIFKHIEEKVGRMYESSKEWNRLNNWWPMISPTKW